MARSSQSSSVVSGRQFCQFVAIWAQVQPKLSSEITAVHEFFPSSTPQIMSVPSLDSLSRAGIPRPLLAAASHLHRHRSNPFESKELKPLFEKAVVDYAEQLDAQCSSGDLEAQKDFFRFEANALQRVFCVWRESTRALVCTALSRAAFPRGADDVAGLIVEFAFGGRGKEVVSPVSTAGDEQARNDQAAAPADAPQDPPTPRKLKKLNLAGAKEFRTLCQELGFFLPLWLTKSIGTAKGATGLSHARGVCEEWLAKTRGELTEKIFMEDNPLDKKGGSYLRWDWLEDELPRKQFWYGRVAEEVCSSVVHTLAVQLKSAGYGVGEFRSVSAAWHAFRLADGRGVDPPKELMIDEWDDVYDGYVGEDPVTRLLRPNAVAFLQVWW